MEVSFSDISSILLDIMELNEYYAYISPNCSLPGKTHHTLSCFTWPLLLKIIEGLLGEKKENRLGALESLQNH